MTPEQIQQLRSLGTLVAYVPQYNGKAETIYNNADMQVVFDDDLVIGYEDNDDNLLTGAHASQYVEAKKRLEIHFRHPDLT